MIRSFRAALKVVSWLISLVWRERGERVVFLMYHRVTGTVPLEIDLPFPQFERQARWLAATGSVISLDEAVRRLKERRLCGRTWYVITFDDAYADFHAAVFPLCRDLGLPVTLYVPTGFLDAPGAPPVSRPSAESASMSPITWAQLQALARSPLVTIGGHTHSHRELPTLTDAEVLAEVRLADDAIAAAIAKPVRHFAYPRGVWDSRVETVLENRYETITLVGGGAAFAEGFNPMRIPRIPIMRSDGLIWFRSRIAGRLIWEERLVGWLQGVRRRRARADY